MEILLELRTSVLLISAAPNSGVIVLFPRPSCVVTVRERRVLVLLWRLESS